MKNNNMNKREQNIGTTISYFTIVLFLLYFTLLAFGFKDEVFLLSALGVIFISSFFLCFFTLRAYRKKGRTTEIDYLNIGVQRYLLGIFMVFYGLPKLLGTFFDYQLFALDSKLMDVSEFQLAWYYFGKNKWQELFAGFMELIPALLLFRRQTYFLGAVILLPVTTQVFILNLFFKIGGVTFPAATVLLSCNLYIVYSQKEKILSFIRTLNFEPNVNISNSVSQLIRIAKWSTVLLVGYLFYKNLKPIFYKDPEKLNYEQLIGVYALENVVKNGTKYTPNNDSLLYKQLYIEKQSRWNILRRFNNQTDAFVMDIKSKNDSINLYINSGGIGDDKDIIDSLTVLKGVYQLNGDELTIKGIQMNDTLALKYKKQDKIKPKKWFW
jgi:hypothetical protein